MRILPEFMRDLLSRRLFLGENRPCTRITIEPAWYLTPSSGPVGARPSSKLPIRWWQDTANDQTEVEIPQEAWTRVYWSRSIDTDAAVCDITLKNQSMLPITRRRLGNPGWFTPSRGESPEAQARWGHEPNEWAGLLDAPAVIRTYQGYGGHDKPLAQALADGNLVLTGVWIVDDGLPDHRGQYTLKCRDMGALLVDQPLIYPLVPAGVYPLDYRRWVYTYTNETVYGYGAPATEVVRQNLSSIYWTGLPHLPNPWPDGLAYWIAPAPGSQEWMPEISCEFVSPVINLGAPTWVRVYASWDNNGSLSVDGRTVLTGDAHGTHPYWWWSTDINLEAGAYEFTASLVNDPDLEGDQMTNPMGFLCTVYAVNPDGSNGAVLVRSNREWRLRSTDQITVEHQHDGSYFDLVDIVKDLLLWSGWWFHALIDDDGQPAVYGNIESTGTYLENPIPIETFDKKKVIDGINFVKELVGYCVDEETEILTRRGWLRWDQVAVGADAALAIDPATGLSSWQPITHLYAAEADGAMWSMEGRNHSSLTTGNHRWLVADAARPWVRRFRESADLRRHDCIPVAAVHEAPLGRTVKDHLVELVAWWWTEGSYTAGDAVSIAQSMSANPEKCERIAAALRAGYGEPGPLPRGGRCTYDLAVVDEARRLRSYGLSYAAINRRLGVKSAWNWCRKPRERWGEWCQRYDRFMVSKNIAADLERLAPNKVPSMDFLCSLTQEQLELFVEVSCLGDGHRNGVNLAMTQHNPERMDAFQVACLLAGYASSVSPRRDRPGGLHATVGRRRHIQPVGATKVVGGTTSVGWERYSGTIWCPTVANHHTWMARRHGHAYFTGNCFWIDEEGAARFGSPNWWSLGNFLSDGTHTDAVPIVDERHNLVSYGALLSAKPLRSEIIVSSHEPTAGYTDTVTTRYTPPSATRLRGIIRPAMWVNGEMTDATQQQIMAELIALHLWFQERQGNATIQPDFGIQIDDQVRIFEEVTAETYVHYVRGVACTHDKDGGGTFDMELTTHWLGDYGDWAITTDQGGADGRYVISPALALWLQGRNPASRSIEVAGLTINYEAAG